MSLVLDASLTLTWYFEDERTAGTQAVLDSVVEDGAFVPSLWRLEVANGFRAAMRRQRIDMKYRDSAIAELSRLNVAVDPETAAHAWTRTLRFADRLVLTAYDAAYLELADRLRLPLASLDRTLRDAADKIGIACLGLTPT